LAPTPRAKDAAIASWSRPMDRWMFIYKELWFSLATVVKERSNLKFKTGIKYFYY
jgi:hypothetical protein